jgi:hypothetical protein
VFDVRTAPCATLKAHSSGAGVTWVGTARSPLRHVNPATKEGHVGKAHNAFAVFGANWPGLRAVEPNFRKECERGIWTLARRRPSRRPTEPFVVDRPLPSRSPQQRVFQSALWIIRRSGAALHASHGVDKAPELAVGHERYRDESRGGSTNTVAAASSSKHRLTVRPIARVR